MLIARMMHPVLTLGPGERLVIWVCGCHRRCEKCANPELQAFDTNKEIPLLMLIQLVNDLCISKNIERITISGGEPFEQAEELAQLLQDLPSQVKDILVFSGYTIEQLHQRNDPSTERVLERISVLVDGEYVDEKNHGHPLRGSDNQRIWFLHQDMEKEYLQFIDQSRAMVQNFATENEIFSVGIHHRKFADEMEIQKKKRGL